MQTHWKKNIDTDWIGCHVLPGGKDIIVKLQKVVYEKGIKVMGKKKDQYVAYFEKNPYFDKPMLLNKTNLKRIELLAKTPYIEEWGNLNLEITLCQEMDRSIGGGQDWALRIKSELPVRVLPVLEIGSKNFDGCKSAMASGYTIEDFRKKYQISKEVEEALKS